MQNYQRIYDYIHEYWFLLYDIYSKDGVAFLSTYYNINKETTVWDNDIIFSGSYEKIGNLSGIKWNKYLLLPIFFLGDIDTMFDAQETGYIVDQTFEFVIPGSYGIIPYQNDLIRLDETYLLNDKNKSKGSLYSISGIKKQSPYDKTFWHLTCVMEQSRNENHIKDQIEETFIFFEYDKNIHTLNNSLFLSRLLKKNEILKNKSNPLYDNNSGFYFI